MDAKAEAKATADKIRHENEFRTKHRIPDAEWDLAVAIAADNSERIFNEFWEVYDRERNDRRRGIQDIPSAGLDNEMRSADVASERERIHNYVELGRDVRNGADRGFIEGTVYACQVCGMDKFKRDREMHP